MNNNEPITDVKTLGAGKTLILGLQHTFAMFGATVLVPILTGLPIATTLLMAGIGTLLFHLLTKGKVPAFLGSSFAFLGGYAAVAPLMEDGTPNEEMLPYACGGVFCAGLLYLLLSALIKGFGAKRVMRFFPPVVTGPIIISIGLILAPSAINNCATNWPIALIALVTVIVFNIWGRGMSKIVPILIGVAVSYLAAIMMGAVDFSGIQDEAILGLPEISIMKFDVSAIITIMPIALATMMEHIGDISAIGATTGKNYIADPGLHRTLLGDGVATCIAALALTKVYDPKVMRIAAVFAIALSCIPKVAFVIECIPAATIGGISFILYGMISAIGIRNVVENQVDFTRSRNTIIAALILVCALGFNSLGGITFTVFGADVTLSGLAIASIVGILANALLPGNEYEFREDVAEENDKFQTYKI